MGCGDLAAGCSAGIAPGVQRIPGGRPEGTDSDDYGDPPFFRSTAVARVKLAFRTALCLSKRGALKLKVMLGTCVHDASEDKVGSFA